ncbi:MAG: hypothetical protein MJK12_11680 [Colwellia sp.]|nr:hypothetical protein [Colwellia sp.]
MTHLSTKLIFIAGIAIALVGCNSTPKTNASAMGMNIPSWVTNPTVESGLVASSCVIASNSFSMDKSEAATQARTELASQIETRVSSLQEEYSSKISSMGKAVSQSTFSITTAQLTDQYLRGSKIAKVDYAQLQNIRNLCTMVTLSEEKSKELFAQLIKQAPIKLDPENETLLYLSFMKVENKS